MVSHMHLHSFAHHSLFTAFKFDENSVYSDALGTVMRDFRAAQLEADYQRNFGKSELAAPHGSALHPALSVGGHASEQAAAR